jgi:hypothetical protein
MLLIKGEFRQSNSFYKTSFNLDSLCNNFKGNGIDECGAFEIRGIRNKDKITFLKYYPICVGSEVSIALNKEIRQTKAPAVYKYTGTIKDGLLKGAWYSTNLITPRTLGLFWLTGFDSVNDEENARTIDEKLLNFEELGFKEGDKLVYFYTEGFGINNRKAHC